MELHYDTVTPLLKEILQHVMHEPLFSPFRLVGGTNISLRYGHRKSDDIDLFTDAEYGSLHFDIFEKFFRKNYAYFDCPDNSGIVGFGRSYYVGTSPEECVKIDLMYHDNFVYPCDTINDIRLASINDIIAMKVDVISRNGRKKDFWDLHLLHEFHSISEMIELHKKANPYTHEFNEVLSGFVNFTVANEEPNPKCTLNKDWDTIKLDFIDWAKELD